MSRHVSQDSALRHIRMLSPFDAARLSGRRLRHHCPPIPPGNLHSDEAAQLHANVYRPYDQIPDGDAIVYVVSCDMTPVAWLTGNARVITPNATLTAYQLGQQAKAQVALAALTRRAIVELALLRDAREHRVHSEPPQALDPSSQVLVANPADPTLTWWTRITGDLDTSLKHLRTLAGADSDVLIVDSYGYGDYGQHTVALDLAVLCALEAVAQAHDLYPQTVGDWLHAEGGSHTRTLTGPRIHAAFTDAYAGSHRTRQAFARAERDTRGWTTALADAGIPVDLFDVPTFAHLLFRDDVRDIPLPANGIAVFRRTRP